VSEELRVNPRQLPPPLITDAMRETARKQPGGWVYAVDPAFDPNGEVPGWAVRGAYRVDDRGELYGEFVPNPNYRPTPQALGLPEPTNDLERALQLAATGHGGDGQVVRALLDADLLLFAQDDQLGRLHITRDQSGRATLQAFTSQSQLPAQWTTWQHSRGRDLAAVLAGCDLQLNPGSPVSVRIPGDAIIEATRTS
jgi:hypothetical protein